MTAVDFAKTEPALYRMADASVKYTVPTPLGGEMCVAVWSAEQAAQATRYYSATVRRGAHGSGWSSCDASPRVQKPQHQREASRRP